MESAPQGEQVWDGVRDACSTVQVSSMELLSLDFSSWSSAVQPIDAIKAKNPIKKRLPDSELHKISG